MAFFQPYQIIGFHSCEKEVGLRIVNGEEHLRPSNNKWDWLGPGIYFWEQNPYRAIQYAEECAKGKQKFNGKIKTPFVIGAIIELGNCLNLVEPNSIDIVKQGYLGLKLTTSNMRQELPLNLGANRQLDCTVIKYVHETNREDGRQPYDTIRSPFHEGGELYSGANFTTRLHMEVCVLNPGCIKAYFLPLPHKTFNPYIRKPFSLN